jgi:hypothetical protein
MTEFIEGFVCNWDREDVRLSFHEGKVRVTLDIEQLRKVVEYYDDPQASNAFFFEEASR